MIRLLAVIIAAAPLYLIRFHILDFPTTLLEVLIVVFLFVFVASLFIGQKKLMNQLTTIKNLGQINYAIGIFVLAGIINTFISPEPVKALGLLKAYIIEPVLLFYAIVLSVNNKQLTVVIKALFWGAVLVSGFGIFQHFSFVHLPLRFWGTGMEVQRITSIFEYPNALSLYLGPLIGFFVALWVNQYPITKNKIVSLTGILVMIIALIMTFSRGAWIAATIGIITILIYKFGSKKSFIPIILVAVILFFVPGIQQRLTMGLSDASSSAHLNLLQEGMHKLLLNPIFGSGLHGFGNNSVLYPHNIILNFWLELGILGLIAFIWIIVIAVQQYKNPARLIVGSGGQPNFLRWAAVIYLLIFLIHGLVDVPYFKNDLSVLFWFVLSLFYIQDK